MAVLPGQKIVGYSLTGEAAMAFRYRYTCGHCGRQTNWYDGTAEGVAGLTKRGSYSKFTTEDVVEIQKEAAIACLTKFRGFKKKYNVCITVTTKDLFLQNH